MENNFNFKWVNNQEEVKVCLEIRRIVFIDEQKFSLDLEIDEYDSKEDTLHLLMYCDEKPAGTARLIYKHDKKWYLGRYCLLKEYRGKKLGNLMMETFLKKCKEMNIDELYLGAQVSAKDFYKKNGFKEFGEIFYDEHCPHTMMFQKLVGV